MKRVEVIWQDAALESADLSLEDAKKLMPIARRNVGYLVYKGKDRVIVCFGVISDIHQGCLKDTLVIPRGDVLEIIKLEGGE